MVEFTSVLNRDMIKSTLDLVILNDLKVVLLIFLCGKFAIGPATESLTQKLLFMQVLYWFIVLVLCWVDHHL